MPLAVDGLMGVGVGGIIVVLAHDNGISVAIGIVNAVSCDHGVIGIGEGLALLHMVPEGGLVQIVAGERDGLGIAVNHGAARVEQGLAKGIGHHALTDSHPYAGGLHVGAVILPEGAGDERIAAAPCGTAGGEVVIGKAVLRCEAEIALAVHADAVAVEYYDAVILGGAAGVGVDARTLVDGVVALGVIGDGLRLVAVLVGKGGILPVVRPEKKHVEIGRGLERAQSRLDLAVILCAGHESIGMIHAVIIDVLHAALMAEVDLAVLAGDFNYALAGGRDIVNSIHDIVLGSADGVKLSDARVYGVPNGVGVAPHLGVNGGGLYGFGNGGKGYDRKDHEHGQQYGGDLFHICSFRVQGTHIVYSLYYRMDPCIWQEENQRIRR